MKRNILRIVSLSLIGLFSLLLISVCGILFFLRTDFGEKWLQTTLSKQFPSILNGTGLDVQFDRIAAPLPQGLRIYNLQIADSHGIWLRIPEIGLRLRLLPIFSGHVATEEVLVKDAVLYRIPELPEKKDKKEVSEAFSFAMLGDIGKTISEILPKITLDGVRLNASLSSEILGLGKNNAFPSMSIQGDGALNDWHADIDLTWDKMFRSRGRILLKDQRAWLCSQDSFAPDVGLSFNLNTWMIGDEQEKADLVVNFLAGLKSAPNGTLVVPDLRAEIPGGDIKGKIELSDQKLEGIIDIAVRQKTDIENLLGRLTAFGLPEISLPMEKGKVSFTLAGQVAEPDLHIVSDLQKLFVNDKQMDVKSKLHLHITDLPIANVKSKNANENATPLQMNLSGDMQIIGLADQILKTDLALSLAKKDNLLLLDDLTCRLNDDLFQLTANGQVNLSNKAMNLHLHSDIPSLKKVPLQEVLALPEKPDGALTLALNIDGSGAHTPIPPLHVVLNLNGYGTIWGMPLLNDLLGKAPILNFDLNIQPDPAHQDTIDLALKKLDFRAAQASLQGNADLILTSQKTSSFQADLQAALPSLKIFDPLIKGLAGSLKLSVQGHGDLNTPELKISLTSPSLSRAGTSLSNLNLILNATKVPDSTLIQSKGNLQIQANVRQKGLTSSKGEPLRVATDWFFQIPTETKNGEARIQKLLVTAPGLNLSGEMNALLFKTGKGPQVSGDINLGISDWGLINALAGFKDADRIHSKVAKLSLKTNATPQQNATVHLELQDLHAVGTTLNHLQANLNAQDLLGKPLLDFTAGIGGGSAAGRSWKKGAIKVNGALSALTTALSIDGEVEADIQFVLDMVNQKCRISRLYAKDAKTAFGLNLNAPLETSFADGNIQVKGLNTNILPTGVIKGDAIISPKNLDIKASLHSLELGKFRTLAPVPDGKVSADIHLSKTSGFPQGTLQLQAEGIRYPEKKLPPLTLKLDAIVARPDHANPGIKAKAILNGFGSDDLILDLGIPLESNMASQGLPQLAMRRPLQGTIKWKGTIAPLWTFVPLADRRLTGIGDLDATISGTIANPKIVAALKLIGTKYEDLVLGMLLSDINADIKLKSDGESQVSLSLKDGHNGTAKLEGTLGSYKQGMPINMTGNIKQLAPMRRHDLKISLSGDAKITGKALDPDTLDVNVNLIVDNGEFKLVNTMGGNIPTLELTTPEAKKVKKTVKKDEGRGPRLNIGVTIPNQFYVRGKGLESEWRGHLEVKGRATAPIIKGDIASVRGALPLLGREFIFTRGIVTFTGNTNPLLDVLLTCQRPTITATASVTGTASSPSLVLSSQPPLPQDEVVAQVLFGKSANSLSRLEALQLANELRMIAGIGENVDLFDTTKEALGVDMLRVKSGSSSNQAATRSKGQLGPQQNTGTAEEGSPTLEAGKYITDKVYVGLEQGTTSDDSGVRVEVDLSHNFSLDAVTKSRGSEVGINWKKDY